MNLWNKLLRSISYKRLLKHKNFLFILFLPMYMAKITIFLFFFLNEIIEIKFLLLLHVFSSHESKNKILWSLHYSKNKLLQKDRILIYIVRGGYIKYFAKIKLIFFIQRQRKELKYVRSMSRIFFIHFKVCQQEVKI